MVEVPPLVGEAMRRAAVVWLRPAGAARAVAAWPLWRDGAAYVLTGPGEQPAPGLAGSSTCGVTVRAGGGGGRIVTWAATVSRVEPGGEEWAAVVPGLLAGRLNLTDQDAAPSRWAGGGYAVLRLEPTGVLTEAGPSLPDGSLARPPVGPSDAAPHRTEPAV